MNSGPPDTRRARGWSLLEILVVVAIIGILASLLYPAYSGYTARADEAKCLSNIRSLYVAASGYLNANGSWPQIPVGLSGTDAETFARNWVSALAPYGAPHTSWICPSIQKSLGFSIDLVDSPTVDYRIDYMPTSFDADPTSPRKWAKYPWFMEKAAFHTRGNLMIYSDGSTTGLMDLSR